MFIFCITKRLLVQLMKNVTSINYVEEVNVTKKEIL